MVQKIQIKGINKRYNILYDGQSLIISNPKGEVLGSVFPYNSQQKHYTLYCEDGKRRGFSELRLLYAYTNNISVLDIPKGCIYRTKYGLEFYNKRKITRDILPLHSTEVGTEKEKYLNELDDWWLMIKTSIMNNDYSEVANYLIGQKQTVLHRLRYRINTTKDVIEDCYMDAVYYFLKRLTNPKFRFAITLPSDALTTYTYKRYVTQYKQKQINEINYDKRGID